MSDDTTKIGFGDESKLQDAVDNNILDAHDLAFTTNDQLYYINKFKELKRIKPRIDTFNNVEEAIAFINQYSYPNSLLGQPLSIKSNDGTYEIYVIETDGEKLTVNKPISTTGLVWIEL